MACAYVCGGQYCCFHCGHVHQQLSPQQPRFPRKLCCQVPWKVILPASSGEPFAWSFFLNVRPWLLLFLFFFDTLVLFSTILCFCVLILVLLSLMISLWLVVPFEFPPHGTASNLSMFSGVYLVLVFFFFYLFLFSYWLLVFNILFLLVYFVLLATHSLHELFQLCTLLHIYYIKFLFLW